MIHVGWGEKTNCNYAINKMYITRLESKKVCVVI